MAALFWIYIKVVLVIGVVMAFGLAISLNAGPNYLVPEPRLQQPMSGPRCVFRRVILSIAAVITALTLLGCLLELLGR